MSAGAARPPGPRPHTPSPPRSGGEGLGRGGVTRGPRERLRRPHEDPPAVRIALTGVALLFLAAFVLVPAAAVLVEALKDGVTLWWRSFEDPDALAAIRLTLLVAGVAVPLNAAFGLVAAWSITRFRFPGKASSSRSSTCRSACRPSSRGW